MPSRDPGSSLHRAVAVAMSPESRTPRTGRLSREAAANLASVRLFAGLPARHLRRVVAHAEEIRYGSGRVLVRQGGRGDAFFAIVDGTAKVTRGTRTIRRLASGDVFGEMALLDGEVRSASVISETPVVAVRITRARFNRLLESDATFAKALLAVLAKRIRELERPKSL